MSNVIVLTVKLDELVEALTSLAPGRPRYSEDSASPWLTVAEAADYLRTTPNGIRAMVKRRQVPFHRRNGRLLFDRHELDEWVRKGGLA
jgi:excisionase family DNA binding protein